MAKGNTIGSVFVRVRPRVVNFRDEVDDKLKKEFSKPIELTVEAKLDASKLDKDMRDALRKAGKKAKISFGADFDGVDTAIKELERKLKDLQRDELEFTANTKGLESAIDELERRKRAMSNVTVEYTNNEAGYQKVLSQIQRIRDSKPTITTTFKIDEESLNAAEAFARKKLRQAKLQAPIEFTYTDNYEGRKSFLEHLEQIKRERHEVHFIAKMDDSQIDSKIRALRDQNVAIRARFDLPSAAIAEGQLAMLARDRWVDLKPRISNRAMATLQGSFMAIAGINSIGHLIRQIEDIALNFDDMAIAASAAGAGLGSLVSVGIVGVGALLNIAGDTLQVFQGLAMAPALLLSGATALQTWGAIWRDVNAALMGIPGVLEKMPPAAQAAVGAIEEMSDSINGVVQQNFWAEMTDEVERFTETIGPHVVTAMGQTATIMGRTVSSMLDHTETLAKNGSLEEFTKNNTRFMEILGDAADVAFKTLMHMGVQGSRYLPRLGKWINGLTRDFSAFIDEATRTGKFDKWIENSIRSMKSLGKFSKGTWDMLAGITRAFDNVGGAGLHEMADGMERIGRWANSSGTQRKMEGIFRAAMDGASSAGRGFADLVKVAWEMDDALNSLLRQSGQLAGDFMSQISRIDFSVAVRGVTDLMDGMIDFVNMSGPAFGSIANIFGRLGSIGGEVAREVAHGLNLTMGAIDGFIARVEGPLINAIHPLTRVFEDIAALGTPALFALANSAGVLLNAFAALPAPLQNVITLLALVGRTGIGAGISKAAGHFTTMRHTVAREMALLARQAPGFMATAGNGVARHAAIMSTRVQAQMNVMKASMKGAFGAGGLMGALGGGWGLAITGAVAVLGAFAGASAQAEAAQNRLRDAVDQTTGAVQDAAVVQAFDRLSGQDWSWVDKFVGMGVDMDEVFSKMGTSAGQLAEGLQAPQHEVKAMADAFAELNALDLEGFGAPGRVALDDLSDGARQVFEDMNLASLSTDEFRAVVRLLHGLYGPVADEAAHVAERTGEIGDKANTAGEALESMAGKADGLPADLQRAADALRILGDEASTAEQRVDALDTAMRIANGEEFTLDEQMTQATKSIDSGMKRIEQLAKDGGWSVSQAFNDAGEFDLSKMAAVDVRTPMLDVRKGVLGEMDILRKQFEDNLIPEEAYHQGLKDLESNWKGSLQTIADDLGMTSDQAEAFFAYVEEWHGLSFDPKKLEIMYESADVYDKAAADFKALQALGMELDESEYSAKLDADGDGFITEVERSEGLGKAFDELYYEATLTGDPNEWERVMAVAVASGYMFNGKTFTAALDVDGQPTEEGLRLALERGYVWDGETFVASADLEDDEAKRLLEETKALLDELDGKESLIGVEVEYPGKPKADEAKADADEIDSKEPLVEVKVEYPDKPVADEAKADADEIDAKEPLIGVKVEYPDKPVADEAKADADEIDAKEPLIGIKVEYPDKPVADEAKADFAEIDGKKAGWSIVADSSDSDTKASNTVTELHRIDAMRANPTVALSGYETLSNYVKAATAALNSFSATNASATLSVDGAAQVVAVSTVALASAMRLNRTFTTKIVTVGGPQLVAQAMIGLAAVTRLQDTFTATIKSVGVPQLVAMALLAFAAAKRVEDTYTATFRETGAGVVIARAGAVRAAINSINLNPTVTFGGRVSGSLNAAAARVRSAAASARAAAALSADGSLSNSRFKPQVKYFNDGGINFMNKPTRAHIAPAGQYVMYAEKETGGEAFIPLAASKRQRSVAIWKETGRRLNAYEDGNVVGGEESKSRAQTQINVTNHYPQAEPTSRTVNDGLDYAAALGFN